MHVVYNQSLSHAEVLEDVFQDIVGGDLTASDFGEGVEGEAEVFGEEVAAEIVVEAVEDALEVGVGTGESVVVTGVCDDNLVGI